MLRKALIPLTAYFILASQVFAQNVEQASSQPATHAQNCSNVCDDYSLYQNAKQGSVILHIGYISSECGECLKILSGGGLPTPQWESNSREIAPLLKQLARSTETN